MWPFKKSESLEEIYEREQQARDEKNYISFEKVRAFAAIGDRISFLGRTLVVTGYFRRGALGREVALCCAYADEQGVCHSASFSLAELPALAAERKRAA